MNQDPYLTETQKVIDRYAEEICKMAVASRMVRVPLEKKMEPFLGYPVKVMTFRQPSKATKLTMTCGPYRRDRVVVDQTSKAITQAARTMIRALLGQISLDFVVIHHGDTRP